jgi:hypothetical protein
MLYGPSDDVEVRRSGSHARELGRDDLEVAVSESRKEQLLVENVKLIP